MRLDELLDRLEAVDARRILDIGRIRVLVALAEPHQRLVGPRVLVIDRDLDDPGLRGGSALSAVSSSLFSSAIMSSD
jgi:hypothetical protein